MSLQRQNVSFPNADTATEAWYTEWQPLVSLRSALKRWRHRTDSHDEIFDDGYFRMVDETSGLSAEIMAASIVTHLAPNSVIDLGCGTGNLLDSLRKYNIDVAGAEFAASALKYCEAKNLKVHCVDFGDAGSISSPIDSVDLVINMEVAHQLDVELSGDFVRYICSHSDTVLFSSPTCARDRLPKTAKSAEYWITLFEANDYFLDLDLSECLKREWSEKGTASWFSRKPMIFRKSI